MIRDIVRRRKGRIGSSEPIDPKPRLCQARRQEPTQTFRRGCPLRLRIPARQVLSLPFKRVVASVVPLGANPSKKAEDVTRPRESP